jgi:adenosylcobinamide amidohydrolase
VVAAAEPVDTHATERGVLVWRWPTPVTALSTAAVGGGRTTPAWAVNVGVAPDYERTDLDAHAAEVAAALGLLGPGVALFTAADLDGVRRAEADGVVVDATVGITEPTWAADEEAGYGRWRAGTINVVIQVPVVLDAGAAVNAVVTATEAKCQALAEAGVPGTGTASDAVLVVWPHAGPAERFAGPRSEWGARIARATHAAVEAGLAP